MGESTLYEKIDPEFKTKWLKALRSGRYKQISYVLRSATHWKVVGTDQAGDPIKESAAGVGYCCLGVGLNLLSTKWVSSVDEECSVDDAFDWGRGEDSIMTTNTKNLPFVSDRAASQLATLNDDGNSFVQIADWIEENL